MEKALEMVWVGPKLVWVRYQGIATVGGIV